MLIRRNDALKAVRAKRLLLAVCEAAPLFEWSRPNLFSDILMSDLFYKQVSEATIIHVHCTFYMVPCLWHTQAVYISSPRGSVEGAHLTHSECTSVWAIRPTYIDSVYFVKAVCCLKSVYILCSSSCREGKAGHNHTCAVNGSMAQTNDTQH